jgi:hypothetical protein
MNAVQRHRNIILDCLRDGDISIRRRALELSFALINEANVRVLTRELLAFLEIADNEFKQGMTTKICLAADRYAIIKVHKSIIGEPIKKLNSDVFSGLHLTSDGTLIPFLEY